jgi:hypothetical protein
LEETVKSLYLIILFLFAQTATAQEKTLNTSPTDLTIIKYHLGSMVLADVSHSAPPPKIDESHQFEGDTPSYEWRAKAELQVQNTGSKSIKSIDWRLLLIEEGNSAKRIYSYAVHSRKALRPGETVTFAGWIRNQSLKAISKQRKKVLVKEQVDITRVEYADGSIWEGGKSLKVP